MKVTLTFFHHPLPPWAAEYGCWKMEKTADYFMDFTRWRPPVNLQGKTGHVHGMNSKQLPKKRKNAHSAEACLAFGL
ncbi:hypothetical protein LWI29_033760 [Acer saccharum]|uniref:Uncharacterized protein n=1 Tax=Acer saccharum TaxID=4024 RepID=A0AA39T8M1_ACESA|nr:hypothetical protein LWI29_033760 [Acer saccharum]